MLVTEKAVVPFTVDLHNPSHRVITVAGSAYFRDIQQACNKLVVHYESFLFNMFKRFRSTVFEVWHAQCVVPPNMADPANGCVPFIHAVELCLISDQIRPLRTAQTYGKSTSRISNLADFFSQMSATGTIAFLVAAVGVAAGLLAVVILGVNSF